MNQQAKKRRTKLGLMLVGIVFLLAPLCWKNLNPNAYQGGRSRNVQDRQVRNASAFGTMLGEFRTGISDIVLMKTERYMHSGVAYALKSGSTRGTMETTAAFDAHQDLVSGSEKADGCAGGRTLIPTKEQDYRGLIGDLHRAVKPYTTPEDDHIHTDGTQSLPWFRVATLSDPHHIRAYTIGGYWLSRHNPNESKEYVEEGLRNNPDAYPLHLLKGQLLFREAQDEADDMLHPSDELLPRFLAAQKIFRYAAELALRVRPHGETENNASWTASDEDDFWSALRMAVLTEKYYGDEGVAAELAQSYMRVAGLDSVLARISHGTKGNVE